MKTKIVKMGNSTGICIPKIILEQCHMDSYVDIQIHGDQLIINPVSDDASKKLKKIYEKNEKQLNESCWYMDDSEWK